MLLTRSPFDLETLGRNVFEEFWVAHPQGPLHFHADGDLTGDWDAARLRQVISNLLGNALQQGTAQGPGELAISAEDSTIVLKVHNGGPPLLVERLTTIFEPLMRYAKPETAEQKVSNSIGLGLCNTRAVVVAHGGTITVASTAEEGTLCTVRLPRTAPD